MNATKRLDNTAPASQAADSIPPEMLDRAAETLRAVAHPIRLRIVELLGRHGQMSVSELVAALRTKPAITSQQLGLMKGRQVLLSRRDGNKVYYRLATPHLVRVIDCIMDHSRDTHGHPGA